jgi:putative DNA-binding protein
MMPHDPNLGALQHWLLSAITDPTAPPPDETTDVLTTGDSQSALQRLAIYRDAYLARLLEVLREQFPCTRFAVGDQLFDQLAIGYLRQFPPHAYTLGRLADKLVDYLDQSRPTDWGAFVVELARLEQAIDRVFDSAGPEHLPPFSLPQDPSEQLVLRPAPGFTLLSFTHPVSTFYTAWKTGQQPQWPQPHAQFVALLRRDYIVRRHELNAVQFKLLVSMSRGMSLGESIRCAEFPDEESMTHDFAIHDWFLTWAASGFFIPIRDAS